MSNQTTLWDFLSATFSPASEAGPTPCDSRDGLTNDPCGPAPALASPSPLLENSAAPTTSDTSGLSSPDSLSSVSLQQSLESRLRQRLEGTGSALYDLTWKQWDMQSGPPICALRASVRRISDNDSIGERKVLPTQTATNNGRGEEPNAKIRRGMNPGMTLADAVRLVGWATPSARDWKDTPGMSQTGVNPNGTTRTRLDQLPRQAHLAISGQKQTTTDAATENTVLLNPAFSLWLLGFHSEWLRCAEQVTPSSRRSRKPSSSASTK